MSDDAKSKGTDAYEIMQASIAQSAEQAVQIAVDSYQRISTIEETVIGIASAKWIATKDPLYEPIITNANENIEKAISRIALVGTSVASVINDLKSE